MTVTARGAHPPARVSPRRRVVAITGADSFLGRGLVGLLEEDASVGAIVALASRRPATAAQKTRSYVVDLTEPSAGSRLSEIFRAENVDTVVHLDFLSRPAHATGWAHELESVGTMHVLHACGEHDLRRLVVRSSTLVYGAYGSNPNFLSEHHPPRGLPGLPFVADKVEAERQVFAFAETRRATTVTVLRLAPLLGGTVRNYVTDWLSSPVVPTVLGFDPLVRILHEIDALAALKLAVDRDVPGTFNIVGTGVLPVSTVVTLAGRLALPVPYRTLRRAAAVAWALHLGPAPAAMVPLLKHLSVADGARARDLLGFVPAFSTRDAVLDFGGALRLRKARLLTEVA